MIFRHTIHNDETNPNYGVYKFKKGFNGEVVNERANFFLHFQAFHEESRRLLKKIVMDRHERKRQKLLKTEIRICRETAIDQI